MNMFFLFFVHIHIAAALRSRKYAIVSDPEWVPFKYSSYYGHEISTFMTDDPFDIFGRRQELETCHFFGIGISATVTRVNRDAGDPWRLSRIMCSEASKLSTTMDRIDQRGDHDDWVYQSMYQQTDAKPDNCLGLMRLNNQKTSWLRNKLIQTCFPELLKAAGTSAVSALSDLAPLVERPVEVTNKVMQLGKEVTTISVGGGMFVAGLNVKLFEHARRTPRVLAVTLRCYGKFKARINLSSEFMKKGARSTLPKGNLLLPDVTTLCMSLPDMDVHVKSTTNECVVYSNFIDGEQFSVSFKPTMPTGMITRGRTERMEWKIQRLSCGGLKTLPIKGTAASFNSWLDGFRLRYAQAVSAFDRKIMLNTRGSNNFYGTETYQTPYMTNKELAESLDPLATLFAPVRPTRYDDDFSITSAGCLAALPHFSSSFSLSRFCQFPHLTMGISTDVTDKYQLTSVAGETAGEMDRPLYEMVTSPSFFMDKEFVPSAAEGQRIMFDFRGKDVSEDSPPKKRAKA